MRFYVVLGLHGPDFPIEAGWRLLGAFSTLTKAQECAGRKMRASEDGNPLGLKEYRIIGVTLDEER